MKIIPAPQTANPPTPEITFAGSRTVVWLNGDKNFSRTLSRISMRLCGWATLSMALSGLVLGQPARRALPTATRSDFGIFGVGGVANTQLPYYADNAAGISVGAFFQPGLLGVEFRADIFPISAKFMQAPATAGLRVALRRPDRRFVPYGYLGGGASRSQDAGPTFKPTPAAWSPCWQASAGADILFENSSWLRKFSWRPAEVTWTSTYTPLRELRTLSLTTGIVFRP